MSEHPIENLMITAMEGIKNMVDVNTIVGQAVESPDGTTVIIPVSKVSFGFAAGGGEYESKTGCEDATEQQNSCQKYPFMGGSGAGVTINPVAFMVVGQGQIRLIPVNVNSSVDRLLDMVPKVLEEFAPGISEKFNHFCKNGKKQRKVELKEDDIDTF